MSIDRTDLEIMRLLQENAAMPQKEIERRINRNRITLHTRKKTLKEKGIFKATVAVLDYKKLGFAKIADLTIQVQLEADTYDLERIFASDDHVQSWGQYDKITYSIRIIGRSVADCTTFAQVIRERDEVLEVQVQLITRGNIKRPLVPL